MPIMLRSSVESTPPLVGGLSASDYENLAKSLEAAPDMPLPPALHLPMQQQPTQQQSKSKPDDKE